MEGSLEAMALNYSSCSFLVNDDCAGMMRGCACWSEEASPLSSCGVNSLWRDELELELELEEEFDPVDLLPTDPFGMNLETTFTAAIASCIEDLTVMSGAGRFRSDDGDAVLADLSYYLNQALALSTEPPIGGHGGVFEDPFEFGGLFGGGGADSSPGLPPRASCSPPIGFVEDPSTSGNAALACRDTVDAVPVQEGSVPHEGMVFALGYLGLRDILSVQMVCKSLHSAVRNDPLLWKSIHIESRLSKKICDSDLLCLTRKSPGTLQSLNLVSCINITDQGLKAVLESNPRLTKLSILGCARLTIDGLIASLKSFNIKAVDGIKNLRVGDLFSLPKEHYEELLSLLNIDKMQEVHSQEPRFFHANRLLSDCNDGYALDIQMCPKCQNYKPVYDCPAEGCNDRKSGKCRACVVCILRCLHCGRCVQNLEYEETFSLQCLCYNCQEDPVPSIAEK